MKNKNASKEIIIILAMSIILCYSAPFINIVVADNIQPSKPRLSNAADQMILLHSYNFEEDTVGQNPSGITLKVNDPADSGSVNIDNLGDVQQNHVALHKSGGSKLIQLTDNISYYEDSYDVGELHFKFHHDNSLFGIHFRDSMLPGLQGILFAIDLWNGILGRYGVTAYTTYTLNQWTELIIYYNISLGWMFEINGIRFGDGYSFSFEHENPSGLEFIQWRSAYSGGGNGYLRLDDIAFYYPKYIMCDQLIEKVRDSPDTCWRDSNKKDTMEHKLIELKNLVFSNELTEAYDKLLHDIKPKLTGLKTDEQEQPWGNGVYKKPWVTCENLQDQYCIKCNLILEEINPQNIGVEDTTPPSVIIDYVGQSNMDDPGVWNVYLEDLESGLDTVKIYVGGVMIIDEQLGGSPSASYDNIAVPAVEKIHKITVIAKDSNQNEAQIIQYKRIFPGSSPPLPPIIV